MSTRKQVGIGLLAAGFAAASWAAELRFDFESGDLQGWQVVDGGFGKVVTDRETLYDGKHPYGKQGKYFLSTFETPDGKARRAYMGIIESPVVLLSSPDITLRVTGCDWRSNVMVMEVGKNPRKHSARYGDTAFHTEKWHVPELVGKRVIFRIADMTDWNNGGHVELDDLVCQGTVDGEATREWFASRRKAVMRENQTVTPDTLRAAVRELGARFGADYPAAALEARLDTLAGWQDDPASLKALAQEALVRRNPLVNAAPILFVSRPQYPADHHNTETMFQKCEVNERSYQGLCGQLKILDPKTGAVRVLLSPGPEATVRDPDVSYDGKQVLFSMRKSFDDDYHIYRMNVDGTGLTQLTAAPGVTDIDPVWLPDGDIVFSATREPKYCMCNRHIMCNLYRMQSDGANIHQIGKSTLFEGHASVMPDGRILYDRWEYVDRNFGDAQGLWVCNADGTGHAIYWGNNTTSPGAVIDARTLSKSQLALAVMAACHDRPWGALGLIDRSKGVDGVEPVLRTWPESFTNRIKTAGQDFDSSGGIRRKYEDPYPLDDSHFICMHQTETYAPGLYYLDMHGNEVLVHTEEPGCFDPMPVRARKLPPVHPRRRNFDGPNAPGTFYVQNVYIGTHMAGVKQGAIKSLRIVESPEKRTWSQQGWGGQGEQAAAMNWHNFENKRILGTVPVEDDGSAYFEVPANTFVFFQALDENGMMVHSMRSGAYVQPGETYGCVGCHENRVGDIPSVKATPKAMKRAPDKMQGWYGPARLFSFQKEVQPVFDKHCVSCHNYGKKAGDTLNLAGDRDLVFCTSYMDLWALGALTCVGAGPAEIQQAYSWGSHPSKLIKKVRGGHADVKLSAEELDRLITWVDINAPYYPRYECAYPENKAGRSPLTAEDMRQLIKLTGATIDWGHNNKPRAWVSFARPEMSRILEPVKTNAAVFAEAAALIRKGAEQLTVKPRADMDGFVPCEKDREREARYQGRLAQESRVYQAIRDGRKAYDDGLKQ